MDYKEGDKVVYEIPEGGTDEMNIEINTKKRR